MGWSIETASALMTTSTLEAPASVDDALDSSPLSRLHVVILIVCAIGLACDMAEMALNGALSTLFSAPPHLASPTALAWLLSATYLGGMVGAPVLGRVADRYGRRPVLIGVLAAFGLTSLLAARSSGLTELTVWRGACGVALGAFPPVMIAYLTDIVPALRRGPLLLLVSGAATLGPPIAIFMTRWLTPMNPVGVDGWRWTLALFGAIAVATAAAFLALPESTRWLAKTGREADADLVRVRFANSPSIRFGKLLPTTRRGAEAPAVATPGRPANLILVWLYLLSPWPTVAFPILTGAVLIKKGIRPTDALMFVGISTFAPFLVSVLAAPSIDRRDRRLTLAICNAGMLLTGAVFVMSSSPALLIASILVFGMLVAVSLPTFTTYSAELYPTASRGLAGSTFWALNRFGSAVAPLVLLPLLHGPGPLAMFGVIAFAILASLVLLLVAPAGREGRVVA
jgi:putative MFS transporter